MNKRKIQLRGEKGFTLIELLVTVTIIGVLVAIVSIGVGDATANADTTSNQGTFNQVQAALDAYLASSESNTVTLTTCDAASLLAAGACDNNLTWYGAAGTAVTDPAEASEKSFALSTLTSGGWLRLHANTGLKCVATNASTSTNVILYACANTP